MKKIQINIDVTKIDKARIVERKYKNKEGQEVTVKDLQLDVIPLKEERLAFAGEGYKLMKVGFVTQKATKEERLNKVNLPIIGDALETRFEEKVENTIDSSEIPF